MQHNTTYTLLFATAVCVVCSIFVSSSAVLLKDRQVSNALLDKQKKVLGVAALMPPGESWGQHKVQNTFDSSIQTQIIDLKSGTPVTNIDAADFDQQKAAKDLTTSSVAPNNDAKVARLPNHALVYRVMKNDQLDMLILPIEGKGLWSTLYGFLALDRDANTIRGLTFYQHAETPGLGGEVDNPKWKALWPNRKAFGPTGLPKIEVIKGQAGKAAEDPYRVDGLSGATITSRGVTHLLRFWLSANGFGPYLDQLRAGGN